MTNYGVCTLMFLLPGLAKPRLTITAPIDSKGNFFSWCDHYGASPMRDSEGWRVFASRRTSLQCAIQLEYTYGMG